MLYTIYYEENCWCLNKLNLISAFILINFKHFVCKIIIGKLANKCHPLLDTGRGVSQSKTDEQIIFKSLVYNGNVQRTTNEVNLRINFQNRTQIEHDNESTKGTSMLPHCVEGSQSSSDGMTVEGTTLTDTCNGNMSPNRYGKEMWPIQNPKLTRCTVDENNWVQK